jgi:hypothetical protein
MDEVVVTGAVAKYRGSRFRILFGGNDWVALCVDPDTDVPDAYARGESSAGQGQSEAWAKVPFAVLDGVVDVVVTGILGGHTVSLRRSLPDGRVGVEFVGPPSVAKELGLDGDQYMGWTGLVFPKDLRDIRVEETCRA